jgi:hypothetical protein
VEPVGFEASVRVPLLVGFIVHYYCGYKIIFAGVHLFFPIYLML